MGSPHQLGRSHAEYDHRILDPGDAGAIPTDKMGVCNLVSGAAAETRTLGRPEYVGQLLVLNFDTDGGGNIVITCASTFNQTANNTLTFADAGECCMLIGVQVGAYLVWRAFSANPEADSGTFSTV